MSAVKEAAQLREHLVSPTELDSAENLRNVIGYYQQNNRQVEWLSGLSRILLRLDFPSLPEDNKDRLPRVDSPMPSRLEEPVHPNMQIMKEEIVASLCFLEQNECFNKPEWNWFLSHLKDWVCSHCLPDIPRSIQNSY